MSKTQSFSNHARFDPAFHFVSTGILLLNLVIAAIVLYRQRDLLAVWYLVMSIFAFVPFFLIRIYALKVQDRVIRLEERLRLQTLAPAEWHTQIFRLSEDQLIGLRFASDDEVVSLAEQALVHNWNRKQIKERVKSWRADDWRV